MTDTYWTGLHDKYGKQYWVTKPSLFAETAINYFPENGKILDLGAGHGQDSVFFAGFGYEVVATDLEIASLQSKIAGLPTNTRKKVVAQKLDLREPFPFGDENFEIVYAHLSLHYFDTNSTKKIFAEISRVLKPNGILAFFTNSIDDSEYGTGEKLEDDFFKVEDISKRYFSVITAAKFTKAFNAVVLDNKGETYKDRNKGIHNLIRFIGRKK